MVRGLGRHLELDIHLIEQLLRLLSMTAKIPFVGGLSGRDLLPSLMRQTLRGCEIGMMTRPDVPDWRVPRADARGQRSGQDQPGQNQVFHVGCLLQGLTWSSSAIVACEGPRVECSRAAVASAPVSARSTFSPAT